MTRQGSVVAIFTAPEAGAPMRSVGEVRAVLDTGLEGDRYAAKAGTFSKTEGPSREVTLIESEALAAAEREYGVKLPPGGSRRNIVTEGVALNHLVGKEFVVGEVTLLGIRLAEPCGYLAEKTGQDVVTALRHRCGLRAQVVRPGAIRVGDRIAAASQALPVKRLDPGLPLPASQRPGDAGLDLCAAESVLIGPGERAVVGTGVAVAVPEGYAGLVAPRSGLAAAAGLSSVNAPGVIDAGYRGEIKLILVNLDPREPIKIERGDRVAQLVVVPVAGLTPREVDELPPSQRGAGGLGSTGR